MNYLLGQLEALGYLERVADPEDQRSKRVHLTRRGEALRTVIRRTVTRIEKDFEAELGATAYAELATPTDAYPVPMALVEDARARWASRGWRAPLQGAVPGSYAPAYATTVTRDDGTEVGVADVLVPQQGPNYTLAKRVQRWRATVSQADGHAVSANVAPATTTRSVTKNRLLAAAYAGASTFGVEVFAPETSRVLMAALLVHDLRNPSDPAHPDDLFAHQAAHGGLWRVGYLPRSVLPLAALKGMPRTLRR